MEATNAFLTFAALARLAAELFPFEAEGEDEAEWDRGFWAVLEEVL